MLPLILSLVLSATARQYGFHLLDDQVLDDNSLSPLNSSSSSSFTHSTMTTPHMPFVVSPLANMLHSCGRDHASTALVFVSPLADALYPACDCILASVAAYSRGCALASTGRSRYGLGERQVTL